jgi:integrase
MNTRTAKLIIRNVIVGDRHLFLVAVPQAVTGTKRVRKFFSNRHDAQHYIDNIWDRGYAKADFRQIIPGANGECSESLNYYIGKFLSEIRESKPTWTQARRILNNLGRQFGRRPISNITRDNMLDWQDAIEGSPVTKHNHQRVARRFFKWCVEMLDESPITRSPMAKIKRIEMEHTDPILLLPAQMAQCLTYARQAGEFQLLAYLCLGGFHGIRTEEILRMDWSHIDWKNDYIHVLNPKKVKRWHPRHVKIEPALRRHLEGIALPKGPILPGANSNVVQVRLNRWRKPMLEALGLPAWPNNTLRHSYKSYHEAIHGHALTQDQMGHSNPNMTRYGYGSDQAGGIFVTPELAKQWFAL